MFTAKSIEFEGKSVTVCSKRRRFWMEKQVQIFGYSIRVY